MLCTKKKTIIVQELQYYFFLGHLDKLPPFITLKSLDNYDTETPSLGTKLTALNKRIAKVPEMAILSVQIFYTCHNQRALQYWF